MDIKYSMIFSPEAFLPADWHHIHPVFCPFSSSYSICTNTSISTFSFLSLTSCILCLPFWKREQWEVTLSFINKKIQNYRCWKMRTPRDHPVKEPHLIIKETKSRDGEQYPQWYNSISDNIRSRIWKVMNLRHHWESAFKKLS